MHTWTIWFKSAQTATWQALELYRSLPTGHYQVAGRFPIPFKHLDWRWKFYPQIGEIQYYDFHGQTNEEGLISLLDLDTVQPGTWQLIGRPDILDELGGECWRFEHQFQIVPNLAMELIIPPYFANDTLTEPAIAMNDIVPHSPHPVEVPSAAIEPMECPVLAAVAERTGGDHDVPEPSLPDTPLLDTPLLDTPLMEAIEPPATILPEPAFVPEMESRSPLFSPLHPVNYVLKLVDSEKAAAYEVDITVMQDDRRPVAHIDLPNPRKMTRLLHRPIPKPKSPLPPKLSKP